MDTKADLVVFASVDIRTCY